MLQKAFIVWILEKGMSHFSLRMTLVLKKSNVSQKNRPYGRPLNLSMCADSSTNTKIQKLAIYADNIANAIPLHCTLLH